METDNSIHASPIFVDAEVIQSHLDAGVPMPKGTAQMIWLLNNMFGNNKNETSTSK